MSGYTRLTLVGSTRRVDVVVPDDEPVGRLLPEALALTSEPAASPAAERRLALLDGRLLEQDVTLAEAGVPDGAVVRIVGLADAPPPPVVLDVSEEAADDLGARGWRWGERPRRWSATALAVASTVAALAVAGPRADDPRLVPGLAAGVLVVLGTLLGRFLSRTAGTTLVLCSVAAGLVAVIRLDLGLPALAAAVAAVVSVGVLALGLVGVLGRSGLLGGGFGLALLGLWWWVTRLLDGDRALAVLAVLTALLLGLLPRVAVVLAGLTRLDDRRSSDHHVARRDVAVALSTTHRTLALVTVAVAASALAAGGGLAFGGDGWATGLALLLLVVVAVRVRAFPLVLEVVALAVTLAGLGLALLLAWLDRSPQTWVVAVALLVLAGAGGVVVPLVPLSPQLRARSRMLTDRLESLAVIAMVPVLVGVFGVYPRLLASFG